MMCINVELVLKQVQVISAGMITNTVGITIITPRITQHPASFCPSPQVSTSTNLIFKAINIGFTGAFWSHISPPVTPWPPSGQSVSCFLRLWFLDEIFTLCRLSITEGGGSISDPHYPSLPLPHICLTPSLDIYTLSLSLSLSLFLYYSIYFLHIFQI